MRPNYTLILPWKLKDEIMQQMSHIKEWSGKLVVPIQELKVFSCLFSIFDLASAIF